MSSFRYNYPKKKSSRVLCAAPDYLGLPPAPTTPVSEAFMEEQVWGDYQEFLNAIRKSKNY